VSRIRLPFSWFDIKDSLWYRPAIMTVMAIILSFITIGLDNALFQEHRFEAWWLFEGGAEGARGVLSAIAGTTMTVATTAFSFTLVALQLSSSQYSPRIVRNFTGDRSNQLVIGIFVSTFVYSLLVLRVVRSEFGDQERFVPAISVTIAMLFAMVSIAALIYFFHHATRTIQASVIITRTTEQAATVIGSARDRLLEDASWHLSSSPIPRPPRLRPIGIVRGKNSGYVQKIRHDRLLRLAVEHNAFIEVSVHPGDFLLPNDPRLVIWAYPEQSEAERRAKEKDEEDEGEEEQEENGSVIDAFGGLIEVGLERTLEADIVFGLQQVSDIALRALSPGVNDPNTAIDSIDRIGELLVQLEAASGLESARIDEDGVMRVVHPEIRWDEMVQGTFMQLRHYAAGDMGAAVAIIRIAGRLRAHVRPESRDELEIVARDMAQTALATLQIETDRQLILRELEALGLRL
jgi:uncharacterized membrane protein